MRKNSKSNVRSRRSSLLGLMLGLVMMLTAFAGGAFVLTRESLATDAGKVIKFSIDPADAKVAAKMGALGNGTDRVGVILTPFPIAPGVDTALKNNVFPDWWNGAGNNCTIEYEYYSPNSIPGVGGIIPYFDKIWENAGNRTYDMKSTEATGSEYMMDESAGFMAKAANGWVKREFVINGDAEKDGVKFSTAVLVDIYLGFQIQKQDLAAAAEAGKTIDVYYRNFYITMRGTRVALYNGQGSGFVQPGTIVERPQFYGQASGLPEDTEDVAIGKAEGGIWDTLNKATGVGACGGFTGFSSTDIPGVTMTEVDAFSPVTLSAEADIALTYGVEADLTSYVTATPETEIKVVSVTKGGTDYTSNVTNGKWTPDEAGEYTVYYQAGTSYGNNCAVVKKAVFVSTATAPIISQADVNAATASLNAVAGANITVSKFNAIVGGVKNFPTSLTVTDGEGQAVPVTEDDDKWTLTPANDKPGEYTFKFSASNSASGAEERDEKTATVTVADNVPVIDTSAVAVTGTAGVEYTIGNVGVTDIKDDANGVAVNVVVTVKDTYGRDVTVKDGKFTPDSSGRYRVIITATDSDDNVTVSSVNVLMDKGEAGVFKLVVAVPEALQAAGQKKSAAVFVSPSPAGGVNTVEAGDKIIYDVYSPSPVQGIGGIEVQFFNTWKCFYEMANEDLPNVYGTPGKTVRADEDLTEFLTNSEGNPVWLTREIEFTEGSLKSVYADGGAINLIAAVVSSSAACSEIEVWYRNIRVVDKDGNIKNSFPTPDGAAADFSTPLGAANVTDKYTGMTFDMYPVYLDALPENLIIGENTVDLANMFTDYQDGGKLAAASVTLTVKNSNGDALTLTGGNKFTITLPDVYTVTVTGTDSDGNATTYTKSYDVRDTANPRLEISKDKLNFESNAVNQLPDFTVSDNSTAAGDIVVTVGIYTDDMSTLKLNVLSKYARSGGGFTGGALTADDTNGWAGGTYYLILTVTDASDNKLIESVEILLTYGMSDITLTLKDGETAIKGATVTAGGATVTDNGDGTYSFSAQQKADLAVTVTKDNYAELNFTIAGADIDGETYAVQKAMTRLTTAVTLTLKDGETAIKGATVTAGGATVTDNGDGTYTFTVRRGEAVTGTYKKDGYENGDFTLTAAELNGAAFAKTVTATPVKADTEGCKSIAAGSGLLMAALAALVVLKKKRG